MKPYKCVNCGEPADELYKTYGPSVLKLAKCEKCKGFVDKYIEYDAVIIMIDLILISKGAQRHILYNTYFKSYWKLLIILIMLETYGLWRCDSLFHILMSFVCNISTNLEVSYSFRRFIREFPIPNYYTNSCAIWLPYSKMDDGDLFIWEKDFYVHFLSTCCGLLAFISVISGLMKVNGRFFALNTVNKRLLARGLSLVATSGALALPALVWGGGAGGGGGEGEGDGILADVHSRAAHYALVHGHYVIAGTSVFSVLFDCPTFLSLMTVIVAMYAKYGTYFHVMPYLREFIS